MDNNHNFAQREENPLVGLDYLFSYNDIQWVDCITINVVTDSLYTVEKSMQYLKFLYTLSSIISALILLIMSTFSSTVAAMCHSEHMHCLKQCIFSVFC